MAVVSVIATIIDIAMLIFLGLSTIGIVALLFAIGYILYEEIKLIFRKEDERDEEDV